MPDRVINQENQHEILRRLQNCFRTGRTRTLPWRKQQLKQLQIMIKTHAGEIAAALAADLGKSPFEVFLSETGFVLEEIAMALRQLQRWSSPKRVSVPFRLPGARAEVRPCPYGTVLILSPWNYPVQLALLPLVSALAAGNCAVLKPSELAAASSALLAQLIPKYLDQDAVAVVTGPPELAATWTAMPVNYIFFTGSTAVGRQVIAAAASQLTPVTLELGGKSPCLVEKNADIKVAARRIVWGKFLNAGQTCVAPDYVLVDQHYADALTTECIKSLLEFFGSDPQNSPDYSRIINDAHFQRLLTLLGDGHILHGGRNDRMLRYLEPTLLSEVKPDSRVMQEEIFGPILPILPYATLASALDFINRRPTPLALYLFSSSRAVQDQVLEAVPCGGICMNDILLHLTVHDLPFGGLGASGMGAYHGKAGFDTFSHRQSILKQRCWPDPKLRYPPYSSLTRTILGFSQDNDQE